MIKKLLILCLLFTVQLAPTAIPAQAQASLPFGDLPGWRQVFVDNFDTPVEVGEFPSSSYMNRWVLYEDGWRDTAGQKGAPSRYYPSKVLSVNNGTLIKYLHTENGTPMAAALIPRLPGGVDQLYGRYAVRFRSSQLPNYKVAWLLWPANENWPAAGEIDFPESNLDGTINAFMHRLGASSGGDQDHFPTNVDYSSWHTAVIEWMPNQVNFILDNQLVGTSTNRIPNTPMHWVLQTESCSGGCPAADVQGYLQVDWVAVWAYNP